MNILNKVLRLFRYVVTLEFICRYFYTFFFARRFSQRKSRGFFFIAPNSSKLMEFVNVFKYFSPFFNHKIIPANFSLSLKIKARDKAAQTFRYFDHK